MAGFNLIALSGLDSVDLDTLALPNTVKLDVTLGALPGITAEGSSTFLQSRVATPYIVPTSPYAGAQVKLTEAQKAAIRQTADAKGLPVEDLLPPAPTPTTAAATGAKQGSGVGLAVVLGVLYFLSR